MSESTEPTAKFPRPVGAVILRSLVEAPRTQLAPDVLAAVQHFAARAAVTDAELYDFLQSIGDIPADRVPGTNICLGRISSFVQAMCNVRACYKRPNDGVTTTPPANLAKYLASLPSACLLKHQ